MKKLTLWKQAVLWITFSLGAGGLATLLTRRGLAAFDTITKPPLTPPRTVFPIAWTLLLILIGFGFALARTKAPDRAARDAAGIAYAVQTVFFFCWMLWFFGLGLYGFSAVWIVGMIASIAAMIRVYRRISPLAANLQIPYLLWCCFALYLNLGVWYLN